MALPATTAEITSRPDALDVFRLRCWARAKLYAEGLLDLHEAVDCLQSDAECDGLAASVGQDTVQQILSNAFGVVR